MFGQVLESIQHDLKHTVFSYIPNTAETSFYGLVGEAQAHLQTQIGLELEQDQPNKEKLKGLLNLSPRIEKIAIKDAKLRTLLRPTTAVMT